MNYEGSKVYDDEDFFEKYISKRKKGNAPNETLELPIVAELLGEVKNKTILDLGCGDGLFGKYLFEKGISSYHGIDASTKMLELAASNLEKEKAQFSKADFNELDLADKKYDLVVSRLAFHYVENLEPLFSTIYNTLPNNGQLIFSVEHPIITSCYDSYNQGAKRGNWIVDNYFTTGQRVNKWIGKNVVKYHKTLEDYFTLAQNTNFQITTLKESKPNPQNFTDKEELKRRTRIPLFLILKLTK